MSHKKTVKKMDNKKSTKKTAVILDVYKRQLPFSAVSVKEHA